MSNLFKKISSNTQPFILFAWPLGCLLVVMAGILMWEDYSTSRAGYLALPTQKLNSGLVTFAVAALPQVGQIVLFYIFGRDTKRGWAALLATSFFLVDLGTDAWFKSGGSFMMMPLAVVESLFIFTLGSEVLFTIAFGFVMEAFDDFILALSRYTGSGVNAFRVGMETLGIQVEADDYNNNNRR